MLKSYPVKKTSHKNIDKTFPSGNIPVSHLCAHSEGSRSKLISTINRGLTQIYCQKHLSEVTDCSEWTIVCVWYFVMILIYLKWSICSSHAAVVSSWVPVWLKREGSCSETSEHQENCSRAIDPLNSYMTDMMMLAELVPHREEWRVRNRLDHPNSYKIWVRQSGWNERMHSEVRGFLSGCYKPLLIIVWPELQTQLKPVWASKHRLQGDTAERKQLISELTEGDRKESKIHRDHQSQKSISLMAAVKFSTWQVEELRRRLTENRTSCA